MTVGDIIDRAARLYRRHGRELLPLVLLPSLLSFVGSILFSIGVSHLPFDDRSGEGPSPDLLVYAGGGGLLYLFGKGAFYALLGGASRSFFDQFFAGIPFARRAVYQILRQRWRSLIVALLLGMGAVAVLLAGGYLLIGVGLVIATELWGSWPSAIPAPLQSALTLLAGLLLVSPVLWLTLAVYSRIVYVPQILLVEGSSALRAVARSIRFARGESRRIAPLLAFWIYGAWSLWLLLMVPAGWLTFWLGVEVDLLRSLQPFSTEGPLWYRVAQLTAAQISELFVAPLAMLGFTLLYLDTRIRREGFDIQLLAERYLPMPNLPETAPRLAGTDSERRTSATESTPYPTGRPVRPLRPPGADGRRDGSF
ncbi:MAG: hypothetical protein ACO394_08490 [Blastocatellia bacterium]